MTNAGRSKGLIVIPLTFEAIIYCLRCGGEYGEQQVSRELARAIGSPLTQDSQAWREYLTRLGWTEGGTVCLSCSKKSATEARGGEGRGDGQGG